jgi:hypothetical protein
MTISRGLSIILALAASVFGVLGAVDSARQVRVYSSWPKVDAAVEEIEAHPVAENADGNVSVKLRYSNGLSERSVWAYRSFLPGRGAKFLREYAVGTRHTVWIDPSAVAIAEVDVGWNLETLLVPLILWCVCLCLFLAATYFWRLQRPT